MVKFQMDLIVHELEMERLGHFAVHHPLERLYTTDHPVVVNCYHCTASSMLKWLTVNEFVFKKDV